MGEKFITDMKLSGVYRKYPKVKEIVNSLTNIINILDVHYLYYNKKSPILLKTSNNLMEYQQKENHSERNYEHDRHFPLETVMLQSHKLEHDAELDNAMIHTGPMADEYTRSFNALALTIGMDIFFRNGAYKPETEEGRKILAHELTHVSQYKEKRITANTVKELEMEAEAEERLEEYDPDPVEEVEIGGEIFRLRRSEQREVIADAVTMTEAWFEKQKVFMEEEEYLDLLCKYAEWKKRMI